MNHMPLEIIHRILEYDGKIKYRNGKYMNQIPSNDYRYKILLTIPKINIINGGTEHWITSLMTNHKIYGVKTTSSYSGENMIIEIFTTNTEWFCMYKKDGLCCRIVTKKTPLIFYDGIFYKIYMFFISNWC